MRKERGITLIALVITIIVIIILAGVSINIILGDNGILTKANFAKVQDNHGKVYEQLQLKGADYSTDKATIEVQSTLKKELQNKGIINENGIVNVQTLLKSNTTIGNGTEETGNIYQLEEIEEENESFLLVYYDKNNERKEIGKIVIGNGGINKHSQYYDGLDVIPTDSSYFTYVFDEETKTAKLTGIKAINRVKSYYNGDEEYGKSYAVAIKDGEKIITDIVLPYKAIDGKGEEYVVNYLCDGVFNGNYTVSVGMDGESEFTSIILPNTIKEIEGGAFEFCYNLTSITLSKEITKIPPYLFRNCIKLESLRIPYGVTSIGKCAFYNCTELTKIEIPDTVNDLESNCFTYCEKLKEIRIPNTVTNISSYAFENNDKMTVILERGSILTIPDHKWGAKEVVREEDLNEG